MKKTYVFILFIFSAISAFGGIFNTSKCFDLLCVPQYIDQLKEETQFSELCSDTAFITKIADINSKCKASKLCNLYSELNGDKNNTLQCLYVVQHLDSLAHDVEWAQTILSIQPQLSYVLQRLLDCGYSEYWNDKVYPKLKSYIDKYAVDQNLLNAIHRNLDEFFFPEILPDSQSKIYILNIQNAFNLSDESFCCTPLILDPEIEKQLRLNFLNIYIHEKLHNLYISPELMTKMNELDADSFYHHNETVAQSHGEGRNEAFVVASEVYISHKLGLRDCQSVYDEFSQYVNGSLVLAPIIYENLNDRKPHETYNDFLMRLFSKKFLSVGKIENSYQNAMNSIRSRIEK